MERALYINKYRNIGFKKPQRLVLNHFTDKFNIGNLVILVGPCNSGKSNVLDALESFGKKQFNSERDISEHNFEPENRIPQLSLSCKDGDEYTYRITYGQDQPEVYCTAGNTKFLTEKSDLKELIEFFEKFIYIAGKVVEEHGYDGRYVSLATIRDCLADAQGLLNSKASVNMEIIRVRVYKIISQYIKEYNNDIICKDILDQMYSDEKYRTFIDTCLENGTNPIERLNNAYWHTYDMSFMPQIVRYVDSRIGNNDIFSIRARGKFPENKFFISLFNLIGYSMDTLEHAYQMFESKNNKGILSVQKSEINKRLEKVSEDFNKLYSMSDSGYRFEIDLESTRMDFIIYNCNNAVSLNSQSAGFRWFFDLYFNLLSKKSLMCGDIIIMDEPATNLHVMGQRELRKFLKQFAINNGITIVLATHVPFLVDIENLDELRVLSVKDGELIIRNDFSAINLDDPDSLLPIKQALTAESFHLYDPERTVVFVEGITDSNYLFAFKKILGIEDDIIFLPIHGVGGGTGDNRKKKQIAISKRLIEMRKHSPILLVDGDDAGKSMKVVNEKNSSLTVIELSDIDVSFKDIESLFTKTDLTKYGLINADGSYNKRASLSALIKTHYDKYEFSEKTKSNFKKLFDKLAKA